MKCQNRCIGLCLIPQAGDQRWVRTAGSALHLLHSLYGPFSKVYGIGRCSKVQNVQPSCRLVKLFTSAGKCFLFCFFLCLNCRDFCPVPDSVRVVEGAGRRGRTENSSCWNRKSLSHRQRWEAAMYPPVSGWAVLSSPPHPTNMCHCLCRCGLCHSSVLTGCLWRTRGWYI